MAGGVGGIGGVPQFENNSNLFGEGFSNSEIRQQGCVNNAFNNVMSPALSEVPTPDTFIGSVVDGFTGVPEAARAIQSDMCNGSLSSDSAYALSRAVVRTGASVGTFAYSFPTFVIAGAAAGGPIGAVVGGALSVGASLGVASLANRAYDWGLGIAGGILERAREYLHS